MPENVWRQNQIPFSFLKSEKKPPFFLSLDENEKLCCWGSQQTLVSTFRNEDEDARTNGAFRFLLRFKRQNTSNFLFCRRRRQPFFNVRLYVSEMSKFWWLTKTISFFKLEQVWRKCQINGISEVPIYIMNVLPFCRSKARLFFGLWGLCKSFSFVANT